MERPGQDRAWHRLGWARWPAAATFLVLMCVAVWPLRSAVLGGRVLYRRDINMVWLPQVETLMRVAATPAWPLWDPYGGFGRPLLADPRAEVLYPVTWLNLFLSPGAYYTVFSVAHLLLAAVGLYLLARAWGCTRLAALAGGALFAAGGPLLSLVSMWHHLAGAAWIPWLFLGVERLLCRQRAKDAALVAVVVGLQVFAGSPDYTALTLPALVLYGLLRAPGRPAWMARARLLLGALSLGLLLAALQWLPTLEWALRSHRGETPRHIRTVWSLPPISLADVVFPIAAERWPWDPGLRVQLFERREPWLHSTYLGLPALALAFLGLRSGRPGRFLGFLTAVAAGFGMGRFGPFYDPLCTLLPPLALLRFPSKALVLAGFGVAGLAALGFDAWTRPGRGQRVVATLLAAVPLAGLAVLFLNPQAWPEGFLVETRSGSQSALLTPLVLAAAGALLPGLGLLVLAIVGNRRSVLAWAPVALLLVTVGAPLVVNRDIHLTVPPEFYRERPRLLDLFPKRDAVRLFVYDYSILTGSQMAHHPDALQAYTLDRVPAGWPASAAVARAVHLYLNPPTAARWGLRGSYDRDILGFESRPHGRLIGRLHAVADRPGHLRLLQMASVTHVLAIAPGPSWQALRPLAAEAGVFARPIQVFEVPDPLPRQYAVTGARVRNEDAALELVSAGDFDPRGEIVLLEGQERAGRGPAGRVELEESGPDRVRLLAELAHDGFVVLTDAFDPGWRVTVDGRPAPLLRANLAFRAVPVPAGRHVLAMVYRPTSVIAGLLVSLGAAVATVALIRRSASA